MSRLKLPRLPVVIALLVLGGVIAGIFLSRAQVRAAPSQPIDFSHRKHIETGVQCLYCHPGAMRSEIAGIPSVQKCMGCHAVIETESKEIQKVAGYWERNEPIPWNRVNRQPDFVYFTHQPHLGAGLNCEACHGDVGKMKANRPVVKMDMGWCLNCHLKQADEDITRLADCQTCHK